jgi:hypothetical protein
VLSVASGHLNELIKQSAPRLPARHPTMPRAHLFGVFLYAGFTHAHGWRQSVLISEATGDPPPIQENFSVPASMRQYAGVAFQLNGLDDIQAIVLQGP